MPGPVSDSVSAAPPEPECKLPAVPSAQRTKTKHVVMQVPDDIAKMISERTVSPTFHVSSTASSALRVMAGYTLHKVLPM